MTIFRKFLKIHDLGSFWLPRVGVRHPVPIFALMSSRRRRRPPGAALAAPDDQTHALTCPQCSLMMLDRSRRTEGRPIRLQQPPGTRGSRLAKYVHVFCLLKKKLYERTTRNSRGARSENMPIFTTRLQCTAGAAVRKYTKIHQNPRPLCS